MQPQPTTDSLATSILNSIMDPLLVLSEDRHIVQMNPAAEKLFGLSSASAAGQSLADVVNSPTLLSLIDNQDQHDDGRPPEWSPDEQGTLTYLPRLSAIQPAVGQPAGWVLALRDVSQFKRLNKNQQEFMRIVSHDLRSPLTAMQGFADMIHMGLVGTVTEKQIYFVEKILSGITQMTAIVENIQDAGRFDPETGFYEMQRTQIDVHEILLRIVQNHIIPAEKQELTLEVRVNDNVPIINADENMLVRAITNLVDNAIKYTPNGSKVDITAVVEAENMVISITDNGYGISEEDQKYLFIRHRRITRQEHRGIKGTGLGLFIVRSVAQRHGGDARVHSVLGEGTTFSIVIPLRGANLVGQG
ncbi:MAG: sensor histidine kinase [Phototrophicaceae bacterium]|jgi:PAS domain S-box-containing protein